MTDKKLEVKNLRISFRTASGKVQAVRDISFDLYEGETLAIVGESAQANRSRPAPSWAFPPQRDHRKRRDLLRRQGPAQMFGRGLPVPARRQDRHDLPGPDVQPEPHRQGRQTADRSDAAQKPFPPPQCAEGILPAAQGALRRRQRRGRAERLCARGAALRPRRKGRNALREPLPPRETKRRRGARAAVRTAFDLRQRERDGHPYPLRAHPALCFPLCRRVFARVLHGGI